MNGRARRRGTAQYRRTCRDANGLGVSRVGPDSSHADLLALQQSAALLDSPLQHPPLDLRTVNAKEDTLTEEGERAERKRGV